MADSMCVHVTVAYSPEARQVREVLLQLPLGATAIQAIRESGVLSGEPDARVDALEIGIWGRVAKPSTLLTEGDRVELCRPLSVDPKVARRERFAQQGSRAAGLFAKRRTGAKAGY